MEYQNTFKLWFDMPWKNEHEDAIRTNCCDDHLCAAFDMFNLSPPRSPLLRAVHTFLVYICALLHRSQDIYRYITMLIESQFNRVNSFSL